MKQYIPFINWLPNYKKEYLKGDFFAGLTVGVLLIPQSMAYAMIAGLPPVYGLYAAIIPQIIYALFGTSKQLSVGPVAMDSILVLAGISSFANIGSENYIALAILLALMVGVFQLFLGIARLGFLVNFLSQPVISGFTVAAALVIGINQFKHLLGIELDGTNIFTVLHQLILQINSINWVSTILGLVGVLMILVFKKTFPVIPSALLLVILGTGLVYYFQLDKIGVKIIGDIPNGFPSFQVPDIYSLTRIVDLIPSAITLALIGFMESYSIAKALQSKQDNGPIKPNQEMISLGLGNLIGSFFGAYPSTGSFSRSAVNNQSGAKTNLSSLIAALLVILTLLFLTPIFYYLPKAILGAIILVSVLGLLNFTYPKYLWKTQKQDFAMWLITFTITLIFGIKEGIISGVLLSIGLLIYRTTNPHYAVLSKLKNTKDFRNVNRFDAVEAREDVLIIRYDSQLYFANSSHFKDSIKEELRKRSETTKLLIIHGDAINFIDSSALQELRSLISEINEQKIAIYFTSLIGPVRDFLTKSGFIKEMGETSFFPDIQDALDYYDQKPNLTQKIKFNIATQSNVFEEK